MIKGKEQTDDCQRQGIAHYLFIKGEQPDRGNMQILWYQHNTQGVSSMISLKKRLPSVETAATSQAIKINVQAVLLIFL